MADTTPILVISTVGQSVFSNAAEHIRERSIEFRKQQDVDITAILNGKHDFPGKELYESALAHLDALTSAEARRRASAELNSLERLLDSREPSKADQLHFLASDTPDGALAARVLADFCEKQYGITCTAHLVEGLQVTDGAAFRRYGLPNLIDTLYDLLKDTAGTYRRVLNPTGGFKGVVPYLTVVGMLEPGIEVSYIYERSPELITLSGMPVTFDYDLLGNHYAVLSALHEAKTLTEAELAAELDDKDNLDDLPIWSLVEVMEMDGAYHYSLGGLGIIAFRHLREQRKKEPVWLSASARKTYDKLAPSMQRIFGTMIDSLADPDWRNTRADSKHGIKGEAIVYKRRANPERILWFEEKGGGVLIAELVSHLDKSYENSPDLYRKGYKKDHDWKGLSSS